MNPPFCEKKLLRENYLFVLFFGVISFCLRFDKHEIKIYVIFINLCMKSDTFVKGNNPCKACNFRIKAGNMKMDYCTKHLIAFFSAKRLHNCIFSSFKRMSSLISTELIGM
jgi:hypothetical protein